MLIPEWIGTVLFFAAVVLSTYKINADFGEHGEFGYAMLLLLILVYAGAIGVAWS